MKRSLIATAIGLAAVACSGSTFARDTSHDAYNQAFLGIAPPTESAAADMTGKAAYGDTDARMWSGHQAYSRAFLGIAPRTANESMADNAADGVRSGDADGNASYRRAFVSD